MSQQKTRAEASAAALLIAVAFVASLDLSYALMVGGTLTFFLGPDEAIVVAVLLAAAWTRTALREVSRG